MRTHIGRKLAALAAICAIGASPASNAQAATPCPPPNRYIAYNVEFFNATIPRGYVNPYYFGCYTDQYLTNYKGVAVGQIKVHHTVAGYGGCEYYTVQVMNGAYQWGPLATAPINTPSPIQSLVTGNVLMMQVSTYGVFYGLQYINDSMYNNPQCPLF